MATLVDPTDITKFNCTDNELELLVLFWVCAAGKNAQTSARGLDKFLDASLQAYGFCDSNVKLLSNQRKELLNIYSPFSRIRSLKNALIPIAPLLKESGIGCYNHKAVTFQQLAFSELNLRTCSVDDLEKIKGIGLKTSRCFVLHSRRNQRLACLDTHILKWLRHKGHDVPKSTPTRKTYLRLEKVFLDYCDKKKVSPAKLDLDIWNEYSGNKKARV